MAATRRPHADVSRSGSGGMVRAARSPAQDPREPGRLCRRVGAAAGGSEAERLITAAVRDKADASIDGKAFARLIFFTAESAEIAEKKPACLHITPRPCMFSSCSLSK